MNPPHKRFIIMYNISDKSKYLFIFYNFHLVVQ